MKTQVKNKDFAEYTLKTPSDFTYKFNGNYFENCRFKSLTVEYNTGDHIGFTFIHCIIENCTIIINSPAISRVVDVFYLCRILNIHIIYKHNKTENSLDALDRKTKELIELQYNYNMAEHNLWIFNAMVNNQNKNQNNNQNKNQNLNIKRLDFSPTIEALEALEHEIVNTYTSEFDDQIPRYVIPRQNLFSSCDIINGIQISYEHPNTPNTELLEPICFGQSWFMCKEVDNQLPDWISQIYLNNTEVYLPECISAEDIVDKVMSKHLSCNISTIRDLDRAKELILKYNSLSDINNDTIPAFENTYELIKLAYIGNLNIAVKDLDDAKMLEITDILGLLNLLDETNLKLYKRINIIPYEPIPSITSIPSTASIEKITSNPKLLNMSEEEIWEIWDSLPAHFCGRNYRNVVNPGAQGAQGTQGKEGNLDTFDSWDTE